MGVYVYRYINKLDFGYCQRLRVRDYIVVIFKEFYILCDFVIFYYICKLNQYLLLVQIRVEIKYGVQSCEFYCFINGK